MNVWIFIWWWKLILHKNECLSWNSWWLYYWIFVHWRQSQWRHTQKGQKCVDPMSTEILENDGNILENEKKVSAGWCTPTFPRLGLHTEYQSVNGLQGCLRDSPSDRSTYLRCTVYNFATSFLCQLQQTVQLEADKQIFRAHHLSQPPINLSVNWCSYLRFT